MSRAFRAGMSRGTIVVVAMSGFLAACAGPPQPLPHSLYYRAGPEGNVQVWQLEADGLTTEQITFEDTGVDDFAVSPADGSLAFVTRNQLFLTDGAREHRRLVADDSQVDREAEDYIFRGVIEAPVFSPDGRTLAYGFDGLRLYDLASGADEHVLTNLGNLLGEQFVFAREIYVPGPWSPDGSKLLIIMGYFEGSTLAVMDRQASRPFTRIRSDGPVCCLFSWADDGRSVLVANPHFTGQRPGLWRYDAETGEETAAILGPEEGGPDDYIGWPLQLPSGDLVYFHVSLERFSPNVGIPLVMVRSSPDGSNRIPLRSETFSIIQALWAPDGSLALLVRQGESATRQVVLARTDGSPLQVLIEKEGLRDLAWGP